MEYFKKHWVNIVIYGCFLIGLVAWVYREYLK